jgi:hypothetical protein
VDPFDTPVIAPECARGDCGACRDDVKDGHPCDHECHYNADPPEPGDYDPGPEVDDEGGPPEYRYAVLPAKEES